jgi:AcrR family transcriptional regulator
MTKTQDEESGESPSTIDRVLANAAKLFREQGYAATSTRQLAAASGLQSASLYHHIGGKEDLLYRLSLTTLQEVADLFARSVSAEPDPGLALRDLVRAYVTLLLRERDRHAVMLNEIRSLSDERRSEVVALRDSNVAAVRELIIRAQDAGYLRSDLDPKYATLALFNLLNWTIFWYDPAGDLDPTTIGDMLWDVFAHGVAKAGSPRRRGKSER